MAASAKLRELKLLIGGIENLDAKEVWDAPFLPQGIPRGAIIELTGPKKTEWLLQFLKHQSELKIFWCEKKQSILPTAIAQRGIELSRITFAVVNEDLILPVRKVLQSQLYEVVIAPSDFEEIRILKALQLFTEKANSVLFLLSKEGLSTAWPISMQLEIHQKDSEFRIITHKQKHGRT